MVQSLHSPKSSEVKGIINAIQELKTALINIIIAQLLPFIEEGPELTVLGKKVRYLAPKDPDSIDWNEINMEHYLPDTDENVVALSLEGFICVDPEDGYRELYRPYSVLSAEDLILVEKFTREFPQYDDEQTAYSQKGDVHNNKPYRRFTF